MLFRLADSFSKALRKLSNEEQKAAKLTAFDLQQDPSAPGLKFHRIDASKDPNFWSVRVTRDLRIIIHKTDASFLICHVDHHDAAYAWAERRRIETHPKTGAAQIVELRERVVEIAAPQVGMLHSEDSEPFKHPLFLKLTRDELLGIGVPEDWVEDVRNCSEATFFDIADHIPDEAAEALIDYTSSGVLRSPAERVGYVDPFDHPDALRRFRVMENEAELERALQFPWDQWAVYLHPSQRKVVETDFSGPARVCGSAGTGKTVVALHRVARIVREQPEAKVLLTTFSAPLANSLKFKLTRLLNEDECDRVTVLPFQGVAKDLFVLTRAYDPRPASDEKIREALRIASRGGEHRFSDRFLFSEFTKVIEAWQVDSLDAYNEVRRLGRKNRLGTKQRERLWPIFEAARAWLASQAYQSWPEIFAVAASGFSDREAKPFTHVVVDEAQDLGVPELRLFSAIASDRPDGLFFAGDLGQRIFQEPFSWKSLGVNVQGRSKTLKVNYRTSHQIRQSVDRLLPPSIRDVDGLEDDRHGTVSIFNGPEPLVRFYDDLDKEIQAIGLWIYEAIEEEIEPNEIGVFVRSQAEMSRARAVAKEAGLPFLELTERAEERGDRLSIGTMHLAKGLEFRAVVVMACDDEVLPDQDRIDNVADETELDEVYNTERHLFYVACTRARERLLVTGVAPGSEFLEDLQL